MPTELPKGKKGIEFDFSKEIILGYGPPGSGKTTLFANFPDALILATEPGQAFVDCASMEIKSWTGFIETCGLLNEGKHDYKTLVIDTASKLYLECSKARCKEAGIEYEGDLPMGKGWSLTNKEFAFRINGLTRLNMGVVFIDHSKTIHVKVSGKSGEEYDRVEPALSNAPQQIICQLVNHILLFGADENGHRQILCGLDKHYIAKSRGPKIGEEYFPMFPDKMEMSFDALKSAYDATAQKITGGK